MISNMSWSAFVEYQTSDFSGVHDDGSDRHIKYSAVIQASQASATYECIESSRMCLYLEIESSPAIPHNKRTLYRKHGVAAAFLVDPFGSHPQPIESHRSRSGGAWRWVDHKLTPSTSSA